MPASPVGPLSVPIETTDFPTGSPLNGSHVLKLTWDELLWASVTVGKARRDVMLFGRYSFAELLHRVTCMTAYYDADSSGRVVLSPAFKTLDPTEKGLVSYYAGMAMAKLYAEKALGIPWMMHISRYRADWSVRYGANPNRPDLFGCDAAGRWAVAEAKGRARVSGKLVTKMQAQKSAVASINAVEPTFRYGSATRFEGGRLALRVVDPPPRRRAQDVPIDPAAWLMDYYGPVVDLLDQIDARNEGAVILGTLPGTDVQIGVAASIAETVRIARERPLERPRPRPGRREGRHERGGPLEEQIRDEEWRPLVERVVASAREVGALNDAASDGVVVRSSRRRQ